MRPPTKQRLILQVHVSPRRHLAASRLQLEVELDGPITARVPDCCLAVPSRLGENMHISADFRATFAFLFEYTRISFTLDSIEQFISAST